MPSIVRQRSVDEITSRVANNRLLAQTRQSDGSEGLITTNSLSSEREGQKGSDNLPELPDALNADQGASGAEIVYLGQRVGPEAYPPPNDRFMASPAVQQAKILVSPVLFDDIDTNEAAALPRAELESHLTPVLTAILADLRINLTRAERRELLDCIVDDMLGYGPLQPLINDPTISEILVNRPDQVFVERNGTLKLSHARFQDETHVRNIAVRIASRMGRRVDEMTPMCDARLEDGSRVNIILPPLSLKGTSISIRKFTIKKLGLTDLASIGSLSNDMAKFLNVAVRSRLSILISGGTGSGKTTLLNAMSGQIGPVERVITIEDAAELQLQQPHVVTLETRIANIQGEGAIPIRDLLRNALRMRPDRIIIGEVRGLEAIDMLQAMNTGHEGSFSTIHANGPRDALMRLETMVELGQAGMSSQSIKAQIASAIDLVVHIERFPDGKRRITSVTELVGLSEGVLATQDLYSFDGATKKFTCAGLMPHCIQKTRRMGLDHLIGEAITAH
ncbi:MAG: CpaF family protein [Verrucomicrobia bacterium]|nr:CpaF family protein [Verrucomicrobiota bacterium]